MSVEYLGKDASLGFGDQEGHTAQFGRSGDPAEICSVSM